MKGRKPHKFYRLPVTPTWDTRGVEVFVDTGRRGRFARKPFESWFSLDYPIAVTSKVYAYFYDNEHDELVFILTKDDGERWVFLNIFKYGNNHDTSAWLIECLNDWNNRIVVFDMHRDSQVHVGTMLFDDMFKLKPLALIEYLTEYID